MIEKPDSPSTSTTADPARPIASTTRIGHVHLKVADLDRAITFYHGVLGFEITQRYGSQAAFLSAGGYHHHIGLNTWESRGGPRPATGTTGLYHLAILYARREEMADALRRLIRHGIPLGGASDHGVSQALYLDDPDGNGVELYWDRDPSEWPVDADGNLRMVTLEALNNAAEEIRTAGGEALICPVDVADAEAVELAAASVEARWGRIDTWVNCAMATVFASVMETTAEEFRRVTEVTYLGYVYGTQAALRRMVPQDRGTIVQVGSALAYRSIPLQSAYCAAKHAIVGFTDSLRSELIHEGSNVRLTAVHLPAVNTPQPLLQRNKMPRQQQPVPPIFAPEAIAEAIVWASERAPREMLVGRPTVQAVWGQKLVPGLLDRFLARAAWKGQFADEPNRQDGRDILFAPLPGDPGAVGPYRDRQRGPDFQMWLHTHRTVALASTVAAAALSTLALFRRDQR